MWERIGVQPGVGGGRIRQYTAAGGALMIDDAKAFDDEARLESVLRGRATGLHMAESRGRESSSFLPVELNRGGTVRD